jgi:pyruvate formate lyase activating enzyme
VRNKLVGLGGWLKNSFIDYPGTVSTVLFFSGCNLKCPFCHNKPLVNRTVDLSMISNEVWEFLDKRKGLVDGVVITGGEPTLYPYLRDVISEIRATGYMVKLDTNGLLPDIAESFVPDYLALDIKTIPANYGRLLGAALDGVEDRLMRSLAMVRRMGGNAEVRITVAPNLVDRQVIEALCPLIDGVSKVILQPMNQDVELLDPSYETMAAVPEEDIRFMRDRLAEYAGTCSIRGE